MGIDSIPVADATEEEFNWKEINNALERIMSVTDHLKKIGLQVSSVAKATLLSAMHVNLIEVSGDPFKAASQMISFIHKYAIPVCNSLKSMLADAIKTEQVQGQKINKEELESMEAMLVNMEMMLSKHHTMTAEEITGVLTSQQELAGPVEVVAKKHDSLTVARALIVMAQQFMFFDMQGDLVSAQAVFTDQQHLLWDVAVANAKKIMQAAVESGEGKTN